MSPGIINPRNERFRLIAFQNIQKISNPSSINIFLVRRKLTKNQKFPKIRPPDSYQIPTKTYVGPLGANRVHTGKKNVQYFVEFF